MDKNNKHNCDRQSGRKRKRGRDGSVDRSRAGPSKETKNRKNHKANYTVNIDDNADGNNKRKDKIEKQKKFKWRNRNLWDTCAKEELFPVITVNTKDLEKRGYILAQHLKTGQYTTVYKASYIDKHTRRLYNLIGKVYDLSQATTATVNLILREEIKILLCLNHNSVVKVHSILQSEAKLLVFSSYAERGSMLKWVSQYGPVREGHARIWLKEMVDGLSYLHQSNIAHRDFTCSNVHLTHTYHVLICDFGRACCTVQNGKQVLSEGQTTDSFYAAPETLHGAYNPKLADVWSLGVVLFVMLTGNLPFQSDEPPRVPLSHTAQLIITSLLTPDVLLRMNLNKLKSTEFASLAQVSSQYGSFEALADDVLQDLVELYTGQPKPDRGPTLEYYGYDTPTMNFPVFRAKFRGPVESFKDPKRKVDKWVRDR